MSWFPEGGASSQTLLSACDALAEVLQLEVSVSNLTLLALVAEPFDLRELLELVVGEWLSMIFMGSLASLSDGE